MRPIPRLLPRDTTAFAFASLSIKLAHGFALVNSLGEMNSNNKNKISITVNWKYNQQANPAFIRLMMLLLEPREKRRVNRDEQRNPQ